ncbi:hypothetical protein IQ219_02575 [Synechocystis sp. LEGE 06083]|nr:hypothetical protein [Synechocystis sp. LEGE 06083]
MKERPIIFNGEMVRAILDGRKTQTRRLIKPQPEWNEFANIWQWKGFAVDSGDSPSIYAPYASGDRLWVRETWAYLAPNSNKAGNPNGVHTIAYRATDANPEGIKWRPSIHMKREASRITLEITGVRVEQLWDISDTWDALSEGIEIDRVFAGKEFHYKDQDVWKDYLFGGHRLCLGESFATLWDSIYSEKYPHNSNPWVWVVEFRLLEGGEQ